MLNDLHTSSALPSVHHAAVGHLEHIRGTIQSSQCFTCVSGRGGVAMGVIGLAAGGMCAVPAVASAWLVIWLGAAVVSLIVGSAFLLEKAAREGVLLTRGLPRRFLLSLGPPLLAGAIITAAMISRGDGGPIQVSVIPGIWLLFYGIGVLTGGALSVRALPLMGACFLVLGCGALAAPAYGLSMLTIGFGGLHIVFGLIVERYCGG